MHLYIIVSRDNCNRNNSNRIIKNKIIMRMTKICSKNKIYINVISLTHHMK